jgi:hypothetical protein
MKTLSKFTKGSYSRKEVSPLRKMSTFETMGNCEIVDEKGNELRKARSVNNACYNRKKMTCFTGGVCNGSGGGKCKGEKKVAFVDEKYYIPLVEVVDVQSYKKYNLNEGEEVEKNEGCGNGRMDNRKNVCCVIG